MCGGSDVLRPRKLFRGTELVRREATKRFGRNVTQDTKQENCGEGKPHRDTLDAAGTELKNG
ncbi:hypothetical protein GobsT_64870 [Gemmata obscuriglobus]|nr:hypothetical protein GobsT_64870 [Gemmata obscuriglobus]VTS10988.1 unnamed protein product [Gemmata obscuriglobus UQM 2246]